MNIKRELTRLFDDLDDRDRHALLNFARFLREQAVKTTDVSSNGSLPLAIAAAPGESVVGALKRLSASYPMLEKSSLLDEATVLMAQHTLQGRAREDVIVDMEALFLRHYQSFVAQGKP